MYLPQLKISVSKTTYLQTKGSAKDTPILKNHCDLCNDELPKEADNIQYLINVLDEIDDSFESEYDKHEPRLLLCSYWQQGIHDSQLLHCASVTLI